MYAIFGATGKVGYATAVALREADLAEKLHEGIHNLANALKETQPSRVLAISDYGAHVKNDIGMPTICRGLEERFTRIGGHEIILRSAEHMQGWERVIPAVEESGTLQTVHYPVDKPLPTISAPDLGPMAARLLLRPLHKSGVDVVHAEVPQAQWEEVFERVMKPSLAELLIKANDAQNQGGLVDIGPDSNEVCFGTTTLFDALGQSLMSL
ncbi:hypothetical protein QSH57_007107 [Fusarium oxysporum f. sp. vasinfectum]|nr:hypothetical protein QSH57_007107 [Fusarium oxysporum f. sp. vasinfectum]